MRERFGVPLETNENSTAAENRTVAQFNVDFNLLYTLYSVPNTVLPLFGGALVDRFGARVVTVSTVLIAAVGQLGFTLGADARLWPVMWASRSVFGIGTETLVVSQRIIVADWFIGRELALAMGIVLAFGRVGSTINDVVSVLFTNCVDAYWVGLALCGLSLLCAVSATIVDRNHEESVRRQVKPAEWEAFTASRAAEPRGSLRDARSFPLRYWLFGLMALTCFPPVSSFNNVSGAIIQARWTAEGIHNSPDEVNHVMGILYAVASGLALGVGHIVDRVGRRAIFVAVGVGVVSLCHFLFTFTDITVFGPVFLMGFGFSFLAAAFWPAIAYVVPPHCFGVAYGLVGAFQNIGLATVPQVIAQLQPPACNGTYFCVCLFLACLALFGMLISLWSHVLEVRDARALELQLDLAQSLGADFVADLNPKTEGNEARHATAPKTGGRGSSGSGSGGGLLALFTRRPGAGRPRGPGWSHRNGRLLLGDEPDTAGDGDGDGDEYDRRAEAGDGAHDGEDEFGNDTTGFGSHAVARVRALTAKRHPALFAGSPRLHPSPGFTPMPFDQSARRLSSSFVLSGIGSLNEVPPLPDLARAHSHDDAGGGLGAYLPPAFRAIEIPERPRGNSQHARTFSRDDTGGGGVGGGGGGGSSSSSSLIFAGALGLGAGEGMPRVLESNEAEEDEDERLLGRSEHTRGSDGRQG